MVVLGRAKTGMRGSDYYGLVEALQKPGAVSVARTISVASQGRVPIRNLHDFPVSIGRYQKLGRLFQVEETDIHGACDVSLKPGAGCVVEVGLIDAGDEMEEDQVFEVLKLADRPDLTQGEQDQLVALLRKSEKVFSGHKEDFGMTDAVQHRIPTGNAATIRERFQPLPHLMYKDMRSLLASGYWQVEVDPQDREKMAFMTPPRPV